MEGDLRVLLGRQLGTNPEEIPAGDIPRELAQKKSPREAWLDILFEKYLKITLAVLFGILLVALIFVFLKLRGEKEPEPQPLVYHAVCEEAQCKLTRGEGADECQIDEDCQPLPQAAPLPIIPVDVETIVLRETSYEAFLGSLSILTQTVSSGEKWPDDTLVALLLAQGTGSTPRSYLDFREATSVLDVQIPPTLIPLIKNYTLFLYTAGNTEKARCQEDGIGDPQCWGPRLVLALSRIGTNENISFQLRGWEPTMLEDIKPLILASQTNPARHDFQDFIYKGQLIRYKNLEISTVTVNYALVNDLIIIGTSKESIFAALDHIL